jgi:ferric-dicitrate binding protein FerR (iron transport regulator)
MSNDRLQELMTRSLSGEASAEELQELENLLAADTGALSRYRLLQQFWNQHDAVSQPAVEEALHNMLGQLNLTPTSIETYPSVKVIRLQKLRRFIAAAVVLIALGGIAFWYWNGHKKTGGDMASMVQKHNARGTKSTIELEDGSKIWLNADSKLQYPEVFTGNTREVYLNGEAFFEVAKNPARPFIIHLANGTVRVLGTSFNIRAYDNEKVVETSVATGKVAFIPKKQKSTQTLDTFFITPNNKVRYTLEEELVDVVPTTASEDKAWTEGRLTFKDMALEEIAIELERNFGKKVTFLDEAPKHYRLTGSFQNNSLDEIMYYLTQTKDFYYKVTNSELLIASEAINLQ